jgi:hypothetical protein
MNQHLKLHHPPHDNRRLEDHLEDPKELVDVSKRLVRKLVDLSKRLADVSKRLVGKLVDLSKRLADVSKRLVVVSRRHSEGRNSRGSVVVSRRHSEGRNSRGSVVVSRRHSEGRNSKRYSKDVNLGSEEDDDVASHQKHLLNFIMVKRVP